MHPVNDSLGHCNRAPLGFFFFIVVLVLVFLAITISSFVPYIFAAILYFCSLIEAFKCDTYRYL